MHAQGIIDFGSGQYQPPVHGAPTTYTEKGFLFQIIAPTPAYPLPNDFIYIIDAGSIDPYVPYNSTAYLAFFQVRSPDSYVTFGQTSGDAFGLISVQLANLPSYPDYDVTFIGTKADGITTVSQTFDIPAGSSFQNYYFDSDFASGLVSVDIKTTQLLMDNLQFIPEPTTITLLAFGFLAGFQAFRKRRQ